VTGAKGPRSMAKRLPFLAGDSHLLGHRGFKPELDQGPGCLSQLIMSHIYVVFSFFFFFFFLLCVYVRFSYIYAWYLQRLKEGIGRQAWSYR
jgi:hypothetical protein